MRIGYLTGIAALALLGGCQPDAPQSPANAGAGAPSPTPSPPPPENASAERSPLRDWLVGTWTTEQSCQTDFLIHYNADGSVDNYGDVGTWTVEREEVTEAITEKLHENGDEPVKLDPPEKRTYTVMRSDPTHGIIRFQGRSVPITRC